MPYETLDGYTVIATTANGILVKHTQSKCQIWIPRSMCEEGDQIEAGETDVCVARWFAVREGLAE